MIADRFVREPSVLETGERPIPWGNESAFTTHCPITTGG